MGAQSAVLRLGDLAVTPQKLDEFGLFRPVDEEKFGQLAIGPGRGSRGFPASHQRIERRGEASVRFHELVGRRDAAIGMRGYPPAQPHDRGGAVISLRRNLDRSIGVFHTPMREEQGENVRRGDRSWEGEK